MMVMVMEVSRLEDQVLQLRNEEREKTKISVDQGKGIKYVFVLVIKTLSRV
jgi:hypothetical protein